MGVSVRTLLFPGRPSGHLNMVSLGCVKPGFLIFLTVVVLGLSFGFTQMDPPPPISPFATGRETLAAVVVTTAGHGAGNLHPSSSRTLLLGYPRSTG